MVTVTDYFSIKGPVPFVNVHVDRDNRIFVDPFAIRMGLGPTHFATSANNCTKTFFDEVTHCSLSPIRADRDRGLALLQRFLEPYETRFGMSRVGFHGHGAGEGIGEVIWNVLTTNASALVRLGILQQLEETPLFVPGVDRDITSDLTTRVIFEPLVDFTNEMVLTYPELKGGTGIKTFTRQVWNPSTLRWEEKRVELPTVDDEPLLLVPTEWASRGLMLHFTRFFDVTMLGHIQMERATVDKKGKVHKPSKGRLKEDPKLPRSYETLIREVTQAFEKHKKNLVIDFEKFAARKRQMKDDEA